MISAAFSIVNMLPGDIRKAKESAQDRR